MSKKPPLIDITSVRRDRRSIRFQLSTLLLLSTLNGIAFAAAAVFLLRTMIGGPTPQVAAVRRVSDAVTDTQSSLVLLAVTDNASVAPPADPEVALTSAQSVLTSLGPLGASALEELGTYRRSVKRWQQFVQGHSKPGAARDPDDIAPSPAPSDGASPQATRTTGANRSPVSLADAAARGPAADWVRGEGEALLADLTLSYRRLLGELALLADETRPEWLDQAVSWFPSAITYVLVVSLATVIMAFRIKQILTEPLDRLRLAAGAVSAGTLETEIPALDGATEIKELARSLEAMRGRLVASINTLDGRNDELASILDSLNDGVMVLDRGGVVTECSPRTFEILAGRTEEGAPPRQGLKLTDVFPTLSSAPLDRQMGKDHELEFKLADASRRYISIRLVPIRGHAERGALAVVRDITRLQEIEHLKRDFLSVVTHELKTPLTSIEGYTRLLLMGKGGPLSEKQQTFARTIIDQTMSLKTMIQNLLDSTRLEGARLPVQPVPLKPVEAMQIAANSFRGSAQTRHVSMRVDVGALEPAVIKADPFRLQQVLGNLLNNALKFTPEGGEIALLGGCEQDSAWMAVEDTGRGIPTEALPLLFNKFYQVAQGDTRIAGGAGLGLFICKQLVEAQGGRIEVSSTMGVGSRFTLWFPLAGPEDAVAAGDGATSITAEAADGMNAEGVTG